MPKLAKVGVYGGKDRDLQRKMSYERTALTHKTANVYKYLGVSTNPVPDLDDIQDKVLLENRDIAYDPVPVELNVHYDLLPENSFDLSRFGIVNPIGNTQIFKFHINSFDDNGLGRYIMVGDIIEIPFLAEGDLGEIKAFWKVTDVDNKTSFESYYSIVTTVPMSHMQETLGIDDGDNNNADILDALQASVKAEQEDSFVDAGLSNDEFNNIPEDVREEYDPGFDVGSDFLDDPNKRIF